MWDECQVVVGGVLGPMQVPIVPEAWGYGDGEAPGVCPSDPVFLLWFR